MDLSSKERVNAITIGINGMLWQTQEECAELIKAISKYNRSRGFGQKTEIGTQGALSNLVEELADVEICIRHIKYLMNINTDGAQEDAIDKVYYRYLNNSDK